jgi:hypothetical protein
MASILPPVSACFMHLGVFADLMKYLITYKKKKAWLVFWLDMEGLYA